MDGEAGENGNTGYGQAAPGYSDNHTRIVKVGYSHDAMIDMIINEPRVSQNQLASKFGYTAAWVSRVMGSDAFQARLAERRKEVVDPFLVASLDERFRGLAIQSMEILARKLEATDSADLAIKTLDLSSKAMGFGARERNPGGNITNNFVVALPGKAPSADAWEQRYAGSTIEAHPISTTVSRDPTEQPEPTKLADSES